MGKFSQLGNALYSGERSIDFIGRRWLWYASSGLIVLLAAAGLYFKGLTPGIEFVGGSEFRVSLPAEQVSQVNADKLKEVVAGTGIEEAASPVVTTSGTEAILIQTKSLDSDERVDVVGAIAESMGVDAKEDISESAIGPSWGQQVLRDSLIGLGVFLLAVVLFIWAYFRTWKMSVAAIVALAHDVLITVGIYAWSGFEVTPATVTGFLTILGFSLYDTVVVFDKVRENTKNLARTHQTYAEAANLAVNQTLVRSINTSIVALIPVAAILYVGVTQLGSGSLKDLALALFVGMAAGAYSSIFIATPLLAHMKSREEGVRLTDRRAKARQRRAADPYAAVPVFKEDMTIEEEPAAGGRSVVRRGEDQAKPRTPSVENKPAALGRGRVVPVVHGEVAQSGAANRVQPTRKSRAKRGKK
jgi:preprotein translocase subunit SecF